MPLWFRLSITCLTKLRNELISASGDPIGDQNVRATLLVSMSKNSSVWDGLQNLSLEDCPSNNLGPPLAMKSFINGFTWMLHLLLGSWYEHIASTEVTPRNIKKSHIPDRVSIKEHPKTVPKRIYICHC